MTRTIHSPGQVALCEALISARHQAGLSQQQLAALLECQQSLIARIESGQRRVDVVEFVVLVRALGADASEILLRIEAKVDRHRL